MSARKLQAAVLIDNPNAGRLSDDTRRRVLEAVSSKFNLDALTTTARTKAIQMAREVAEAGEELVIAFGGDGHVNEVANGLAGTNARLGIVPGGTMNVFARALGIPDDPFAALEHLTIALEKPPRILSLGKMDERYFLFSAGCGFDAEAAERVERHVRSKRRFGELYFYWSAFRVLTNSYRHRKPSMTLSGSFGRVPVAMAIACNAGPYAYLGRRRIEIAPEVRLDGGLDVFALKTMRLEALPVYAWRCLLSGDLVHHRDAFYATDLPAFELTGEAPFKRHVDGEPVDPASSARFSIAPDVLRLCG